MESVSATKLVFFDDMNAVEAMATFLSLIQAEDGRCAVILDSTIFHPQGGGQPADTGFISGAESKFLVQDVRSKDGLVLHYGIFEDSQSRCDSKFQEGHAVHLSLDAQRRELNSRLHSAGHLLDICMHNVGLSDLQPMKGYHFPDGPFVEYKGTILKDELQIKQEELQREANRLISFGGKVIASVLSYEEASIWCNGDLPTYISKGSTPRVVRLGDNPGCPCGGTHVEDIANIGSLKITQIRAKKGSTKVFYLIS